MTTAIIISVVVVVGIVAYFLFKNRRKGNKPSVEQQPSKPVEKPAEPVVESKFKVGDRIRIVGSGAKGDVITNIYLNEENEWYYEFSNSDDAPINWNWELVEPEKPKEEPKHFIPSIFLEPFQSIIDIKEGTKTYDYLYELFNEASCQYGGNTCHGLPLLYKEECFPQIYNFYGDKGKEDIKSLVGWLFAMQLAEIRPQNRDGFFKIGYELGGYDKNSNLYGWKFRCDPNIARLVAAAIWAAMRGTCKPDVEAMRRELHGDELCDTINEVRYSDSIDFDHCYYIDLRKFLPTAPGPYAPDYKDRSHIGGYPYPNDAKTDDYNLAIDRAIRDCAVEMYNLSESDTSLVDRTVQAIADKDANVNHLFGRERQVEGYTFNPVFTKEDLGQEIFPSLSTDLCSLVDDVMHIGSYQRDILQGNKKQMGADYQYGRLRPGCSWKKEAQRHSYDDDTENVLVDFYIEDGDGNPTGYYNEDGKWVYKNGIHSPEEYNDKMKDELYANSYPSGHSAGICSTMLLLIELLPHQADKILAAANRFAVNRTIARYHWNSDTIQGRVLATCIAPIIRCCSDWNERFNEAKECLKVKS